MPFHVGQKVVCVDDKKMNAAASWSTELPTEGSVYTIRAVAIRGEEYVRLIEFLMPSMSYRGEEGWFSADRFSPIVERKNDISVFTEILRTAKEPKVCEPSRSTRRQPSIRPSMADARLSDFA
jgi:hypothetical protein